MFTTILAVQHLIKLKHRHNPTAENPRVVTKALQIPILRRGSRTANRFSVWSRFERAHAVSAKSSFSGQINRIAKLVAKQCTQHLGRFPF